MGICACNIYYSQAAICPEYLCSIYLPIAAGLVLVSDRKVQWVGGFQDSAVDCDCCYFLVLRCFTDCACTMYTVVWGKDCAAVYGAVSAQTALMDPQLPGGTA